jgi:hypothetical protein
MILSATLGGMGVKAAEGGGEIQEVIASMNAPEGYTPQTSAITAPFRGLRAMAGDGSISILLIEDVNPWAAVEHHALLQSLGSVEKADSSQVAGMDLSRFDLIVLSNDQIQSTYDNYAGFQGGLEDFVTNGGTLLLGASDMGWNAGYMTENLLGGLTRMHQYEFDNSVTDFEHPVVTGEMTEGSALSDADLSWSYASHSVFLEDTIPAGGRTILRERGTGAPTLVEFPLGAGYVVASGLTWEHNYIYGGAFAPKALLDLYTYASQIAKNSFFFEISSAILDVTELDNHVDITVSTKNNPGFSGLDLEVEFDNRGGHLKPVSITSASGESVYSNIDDENADWASSNLITAVLASGGDIAGDGELFTIRFEIGDTLEYNSSYALNLSGTAVNSLYEELDFSVKTGSIQALMVEGADILYGDARMDNAVDIKDPVKMAQFFVGNSELTRYERIAANVHWESEDERGRPGSIGEGEAVKLDIKDAIKIGRYLAGHEGIVLGSAGSGPAGPAEPAEPAQPGPAEAEAFGAEAESVEP